MRDTRRGKVGCVFVDMYTFVAKWFVDGEEGDMPKIPCLKVQSYDTF